MALYRESLIVYIGTDDPALFWTGHGLLPLPADAVLPVDMFALGAGQLVDIPDLEQLINGVAQRLEFVVSGVSDDTIAFAIDEAQQIAGAPVNIGRIEFDAAWQPTGPVVWEWEGEGRGLTVGSDPGDDGRVRTITLQVGAGETTRSRSPLAFFTDADQRRESPTDDVFSFVGAINNGTSRRWGPSA